MNLKDGWRLRRPLGPPPSRSSTAPVTAEYRLALPMLDKAAAAGHEVERWWTGWAILKEGYLAAVEQLAIPSPATILDVGCADGLLTCFYARRYPSAVVIGVDRQSVAKARAHAAALKVDNVRFVEGDAEGIAALVPEGVFDLILCRCTLLSKIRSRSTAPFAQDPSFEVTPEAARLLAAIAGALRPGTGRFVSTEGWDSVARLHTFLALLASAGLAPDWEVSRPIGWGEEADRSMWSMIVARPQTSGDAAPSIEEATAFLVGADLDASGSLPTVYGHAARMFMQHLQPRQFVFGVETRHGGLAAWRRELWAVGALVVTYDYTERDDAEVRLWPWSATEMLRSALGHEAQDFLAQGWQVRVLRSPSAGTGASPGYRVWATDEVSSALDRRDRVGDAPPPLKVHDFQVPKVDT